MSDPHSRRRGERQLSEEEAALWRELTRSILPLAGAGPRRAPGGHAPPVAHPAPYRPAVHRDEHHVAVPRTVSVIDRKLARRIATGRAEIAARLDLHGMRQHEAHAALFAFVRRAYAEGERTVLVITGRGGIAGAPGHEAGAASERGVLRRNVPRWLAEPTLAQFVSGVVPAHVRHGGDGALYVQIRRRSG